MTDIDNNLKYLEALKASIENATENFKKGEEITPAKLKELILEQQKSFNNDYLETCTAAKCGVVKLVVDSKTGQKTQEADPNDPKKPLFISDNKVLAQVEMLSSLYTQADKATDPKFKKADIISAITDLEKQYEANTRTDANFYAKQYEINHPAGSASKGSEQPSLVAKEPEADYLARVWSHTDTKKPKEIRDEIKSTIKELESQQGNPYLKVQYDALVALNKQFDDELPKGGFGGKFINKVSGGKEPDACSYRDRIGAVINAVASDSEKAKYEGLVESTPEGKAKVGDIISNAQKSSLRLNQLATIGAYSGIGGSTVGKTAVITGDITKGLNRANHTKDQIEQGVKTGKEVVNFISGGTGCKEATIKDVEIDVNAHAKAAAGAFVDHNISTDGNHEKSGGATPVIAMNVPETEVQVERA